MRRDPRLGSLSRSGHTANSKVMTSHIARWADVPNKASGVRPGKVLHLVWQRHMCTHRQQGKRARHRHKRPGWWPRPAWTGRSTDLPLHPHVPLHTPLAPAHCILLRLRCSKQVSACRCRPGRLEARPLRAWPTEQAQQPGLPRLLQCSQCRSLGQGAYRAAGSPSPAKQKARWSDLPARAAGELSESTQIARRQVAIGAACGRVPGYFLQRMAETLKKTDEQGSTHRPRDRSTDARTVSINL